MCVAKLHQWLPEIQFVMAVTALGRGSIMNAELRQEGVMERDDYYRRRALELLAVARAIRDPDAADWLREIAFDFQRLANKFAHNQLHLPLSGVA
jgi:hypothetical protein